LEPINPEETLPPKLKNLKLVPKWAIILVLLKLGPNIYSLKRKMKMIEIRISIS